MRLPLRAVPLLWLGLIFATSSTVVPFDIFVQWLSSALARIASPDAVRAFWTVSWLFFVKGWHATEYAIAVVLIELGLRSTALPFARRLGIALATAVVFAASDEWHQTFVPGRGGNITDVVIDSSGALFGATMLTYGHRRGSKATRGERGTSSRRWR
jgi:VanZ family protein